MLALHLAARIKAVLNGRGRRSVEGDRASRRGLSHALVRQRNRLTGWEVNEHRQGGKEAVNSNVMRHGAAEQIAVPAAVLQVAINRTLKRRGREKQLDRICDCVEGIKGSLTALHWGQSLAVKFVYRTWEQQASYDSTLP